MGKELTPLWWWGAVGGGAIYVIITLTLYNISPEAHDVMWKLMIYHFEMDVRIETGHVLASVPCLFKGGAHNDYI